MGFSVIGLCLLNAILIVTLVVQHRNQQALLRLLRDTRVFVGQVREAQMRKLELMEKQALAEQVVDKGSIGVETVHKAIAGLTFGILEAIPTTRATSSVVRGVHDAAAGTSYEAVRVLNREVGKLLKDIMSAPPPKPGANSDPERK